MGAPLACGGEEWLEPFADHLVQERLFGLAPPVPAERRGGGARVTLPGLGVFGRDEHAQAHRKRRARQEAPGSRRLRPVFAKEDPRDATLRCSPTAATWA